MKFSIITPVLNGEKHIHETIESILSQSGNFNIEYIVVDGGSTDSTQSIVGEYILKISSGGFNPLCKGITIKYVLDKDSTMFGAIEKGFSQASGDVYAWINADDIYLPNAFNIICKTLDKYTDIMWIKGITSYINEDSSIKSPGRCFLYYQQWIREGLYGPALYFIQQDSVFWRSSLWRLCGGINVQYNSAGDYFLWKKFAQYAPLYSLNTIVSCFRKVSGQKSENMESYWREIIKYGGIKRSRINHYKIFFALEWLMPDKIFSFLYRYLFGDHEYHLVTMNENDEPSLHAGNYSYLNNKYELSNM